ncbi:ATP-binding protein [Mesorhizobium sp. M0955]|uniref:ATP-binding protein n=1 Tax=Mesorhizobium sp. M0955 TaxID=2957033 RepID=UPI00333826D0
MQVSQLAELDTHVVIGGAKPKAFFMSDSAEFFTILSSTLYRDKKLAAVREVTCNAWDAHIMVGKQTTPIEITLNDEELVIRDFGPGIADDKMHSTYCGYGVSTKVKDNTQTGGFGLGCKAPFAYSDHFTVVSAHEGWKSTYAISRGGMQSDGKPGLIRMVKVQSPETGITVSIPLKDAADRHEFSRLVQRVIRQGGIQAIFNGAKLPTWDFGAIDKNGYGTVSGPDMQEGCVYVRYGTVLYPLTTVDKDINKLAETFRNVASLKLILSAPPGSVGVTPSREALSYTEESTKQLKVMLERATNEIKSKLPEALRVLAEKSVAEVEGDFVPFKIDVKSIENKYFAASPLDCAVMLMRTAHENSNYGLNDFKLPEARRKKEMMRVGMRKHRDSRRIFRRAMNGKTTEFKVFAGSGYGCATDTRRLLVRLATRLDIMKQVHRYGYAWERDEDADRARHNYGLKPFVKSAGVWPNKPIIVLTQGKMQVSGFVDRSDYGREDYAFIIVRHMKPEKIEAIKKMAEHFKFDLVELERPVPVKREKKPKVEKPNDQFYTMRHILGENHINKSHTPTIDHAPIYFDVQTTLIGGSERNGYDFDVKRIFKFSHLFNAAYPTIALAHGQAQKKALEKAGSRPLRDVVTEDLKAIKDTPENRFAIQCSLGLFCASDYYRSPSAMASDLAKSDLRYAKLLVGKKITCTKEELFVFRLVKLIGKFCGSGNQAASEHVMKMVDRTRYVQTKAQVEWLQPLTRFWGHRGCGRDEEDPFKFDEELVDLIRFLQRKQQRKSAVTTTTQPLKEAA